MDAAHFVHEGYIGHVWSTERIFMPTPSGRKRWNVLGAVNAITKEIVTVEDEEYINAKSVCIMLNKLADRKCGIPITVILDNAPYQRCKIVEKHAETVGLAANIQVKGRCCTHICPLYLFISGYQHERIWYGIQ